MEVQAYCQALIRDANRSCYLHHCKRSSVTFFNKNNVLSGGSRVFQDKTDAGCRRRYSFKVRRPDFKADRKGKLRVVWISMYFQSDIPLKIGLFGFVNSPTHRWKHPAFFGLRNNKLSIRCKCPLFTGYLFSCRVWSQKMHFYRTKLQTS